MAQLDPSNIVNGNTITTNDLLQLYNAFTAGGGFSVSISGSLTGSATAATSAISASNITTAVTGGGTHYLTFVEGAGTKAPKIASSLEYTPSNNVLQVTASYATTASVALNATSTQLNSQAYSNIGAGPVDATFKLLAGKVRMISSAASTATFPTLAGKTLGTNVWVTATIEGSAAAFSGGVVTIKALTAGGVIQFESVNVADGTDVHYQVIYVP